MLTILLHLLLVRREESECLHQLVALGDWYISVIQFLSILAVYVEPPVAFEDGLIEERGFRTEEGFHDETIVC